MGVWTQLAVAAKPADIYESPDRRPSFAVLFLHGVGLETLVNKPAFTRIFDELNLACACPHGQRSWWTDRVCSEFDPVLTAEQHLLRNVLPLMQQRWHLDERAVG